MVLSQVFDFLKNADWVAIASNLGVVLGAISVPTAVILKALPDKRTRKAVNDGFGNVNQTIVNQEKRITELEKRLLQAEEQNNKLHIMPLAEKREYIRNLKKPTIVEKVIEVIEKVVEPTIKPQVNKTKKRVRRK